MKFFEGNQKHRSNYVFLLKNGFNDFDPIMFYGV